MNTRFTKIKFDGLKVRVEYEVLKDGSTDPDEYSVFSADKPLDSFAEALQALTPDVVYICELAKGEGQRITVRGVSLSYAEKDGVMGATITALKALTTANAPLVLNTPFLPESSEGGICLPEETRRRIGTLCEEAQKYVDGERKQGNLFTTPAA